MGRNQVLPYRSRESNPRVGQMDVGPNWDMSYFGYRSGDRCLDMLQALEKDAPICWFGILI
jgi:hypothetical protein